MILLDTNVVARLLDPGDSQHQIAVDAIASLHKKGEELRVCAQTIQELYAIATRTQRGIGFKPTQALAEIGAILSRFPMLPDVPLHAKWYELISTYQVTNRVVFDARIVAAAVLGGCQAILTFNDADFSQFTEIESLDPAKVISNH